MRHLHRRLGYTTILSITAMVFVTTAASAQGARRSTVLPPSRLVLSIFKGVQADPGSLEEQVTLTCDPDGGTHPQPHKACNALREVHGNIAALPGEPHTVCPLYVAPVTATAKGSWQGRLVDFRKTFTNSCFLHRATTPVFDF